jgi:hypothetical protein
MPRMRHREIQAFAEPIPLAATDAEAVPPKPVKV